jgi:hypothetical protein
MWRAGGLIGAAGALARWVCRACRRGKTGAAACRQDGRGRRVGKTGETGVLAKRVCWARRSRQAQWRDTFGGKGELEAGEEEKEEQCVSMVWTRASESEMTSTYSRLLIVGLRILNVC